MHCVSSVFFTLIITFGSQCIYRCFGDFSVDLKPSKSLGSLSEKDNLTLTCNVVGCNKSHDFVWSESGVKFLSSNESHYTFRDLSRKDNGKYNCYARCGKKSKLKKSNAVDINIKYEDVILKYSANGNRMHNVTLGDQLPSDIMCVIECNFSCDRMITVTQNSTVGTLHWNISSGESIFKDKLAKKIHSGSYVCSVNSKYSQKVSINVQYKPENISIRPSIETIYVKKGNKPTQNIVCNADCNPKCSFFWVSRHGCISSYSCLFTVFENGEALFATKSLKKTTSFYCLAKNDLGKLFSPSVHIVVRDGPTDVTITTTNTNISENVTIVLACHGICVTACTYKWTRRNKVVSNTSSLPFTSLSKSDSDEYKCTVKDDYGVTSKTANIRVQYKPKHVKVLALDSIDFIKEGDTVRLKCTADCYPPCLFFQWYRNGRRLFQENKSIFTQSFRRTDSGQYLCSATNDYHSYKNSSNTVVLDVKYEPYIQDFKSKRNKLISPDPLVLKFRVISNPPSNVTILHNTERIHFQLNVYGNSSYEKQTTECSDIGYYYLKANNPLGRNISRIFVNVSCQPIIKNSNISSTDYNVGDNLSIKVTYDANPDPSVQWFFTKWDSNETSPVHQKLRKDSQSKISVLSVKSLSENDFGTYVISLGNKHGRVQKSFDVTGSPLPARNITVQCSDVATLKWAPGFGGGVKQTFVVLYSTDTDWIDYEKYAVSSDNMTMSDDIQIILSNLVTKPYYFKIISLNKFGNISSKDVTNCTIKASKEDISAEGLSKMTGYGVWTALLLIIIIVAVGLIVFKKRPHRQNSALTIMSMTQNVNQESVELDFKDPLCSTEGQYVEHGV